jgi:hypothetical protein
MGSQLINYNADEYRYWYHQTIYYTVLWIRISFNADPDLAFNLNADQDLRIHTDPDPGQALPSLNLFFYIKNKNRS